MGIQTSTRYTTSDGQSFSTLRSAELHENNSVTSKVNRAKAAKADAKAGLANALKNMKEYEYTPPSVIQVIVDGVFEHPRTVVKYTAGYVRKTEEIGFKADGDRVTKHMKAA